MGWDKVSRAAVTVALITSTALVKAAEADLGPVNLAFVAVVGVASGGHQAGNFEVQIAGGFPVPAGLNCDNNFLTTLKSTDTDKRMLNLLTLAFLLQKPVSLRITDDPAYRAVAGRCSIVWVVLR